jgi:hypothetical protein
MTNIKSSFSKNTSLPLSQGCVVSLSMPVSTVCCEDLPCKILDVYFVLLAPRSKSSNAFAGTSTRVRFEIVSLLSGFTYCLMHVRILAFFLRVITRVAYWLAVVGRHVYNNTAAVFSGECGSFKHRC